MKTTNCFLRLAFLLLTLNSFAARAQESKADTTVTDTSMVFSKVEVVPSFPGGLDGWRRYLENNLHYPKKAVKGNIQGLVRVQTVVDAKGKVTEVKALNDPGGGLAKEAERVIKDGPKWIPAERNGTKVTFRFIQNIIFQMQ